MKICSKCKIEKPLDEFYDQKTGKEGKRSDCKKCNIDKVKIYISKHKENISLYMKEYREKQKLNKPLKKKRTKLEISNYSKQYRKENRSKLNKYSKIRRDNSLFYKLSQNLRNTIHRGIRNKKFTKESRTEEILGCTFSEFKSYIEHKWEYWMSWDNYGDPKDGVFEFNKTWDLDHIVPLSSGETEEEIIKLNHFSNFQPLCSYINRNFKKNKFDYIKT